MQDKTKQLMEEIKHKLNHEGTKQERINQNYDVNF